ncbi:MAG TPA: sugar phosphate isomerase/epimerase [Polyangia bacterium]
MKTPAPKPSSLLRRRDFTLGLGAVGLAGLVGRRAEAADAGVAKSSGTAKAPKAGKPAKSAYPSVKIGYAAITWGDAHAREAMTEIAQLGYPGVQLRATITRDWNQPLDLKTDLEHFKLTFACVSGGGPSADPAKRSEEVEKFAKLVTFAKAAGALHVQATSPSRTGPVDKAQLEAFAETLNAIGKRTASLGVPLIFHPHMDQLVETAEETAIVMKKTDPKLVRLLLDTGHWAAAGGDPAQAIKQYAKRLAMLHIKDVVVDETAAPGADAKLKAKHKFVELGKGKVDFKAVFEALKAARFKGWAVVELDKADRAPKDAAEANKAYLEGLGLVIAPTA